MPELPEVEHLRRTLARSLPGRRVTGVSLHRPDVCDRPDGRAPNRPGLLLGGVVRELLRHGKQLAIVTEDGRALRVHLGMTGQLLLVRARERPARSDHVHAAWRLDDGSRMLFRDPRRFGGLAPYATPADLVAREWGDLGPDAASIDGEELAQRLARTGRAIKAALLDQHVLAGVGNIYADESLFKAAIHPLRRTGGIRRPESHRLAAAIRETLALAIAGGGSTLRDYVDAQGRPGRHQHSHLVYGRSGQPCARCGSTLRSIPVSQRTTVFCPACQPRVPGRPRPAFPHRREVITIPSPRPPRAVVAC